MGLDIGLVLAVCFTVCVIAAYFKGRKDGRKLLEK